MSHDETRNPYRSPKEIADDIEVQAREIELDEPTLDAWAKFADLMCQIAACHDPEAWSATGRHEANQDQAQ